MWSYKYFGSHFLTSVWNFNETFHNYSLSGPRDTDNISKSWVQRSRSPTTYSKIALFWPTHTDQQFAVKHHLVHESEYNILFLATGCISLLRLSIVRGMV